MGFHTVIMLQVKQSAHDHLHTAMEFSDIITEVYKDRLTLNAKFEVRQLNLKLSGTRVVFTPHVPVFFGQSGLILEILCLSPSSIPLINLQNFKTVA